MKTHFDEIKIELRKFYGKDTLQPNVVLLLWLPRCYRIIKEQLPGKEKKLGFFDIYNPVDKQVSIINICNAAQIVDFMNIAKIFAVEKVIAFGLAGAYRMKIGDMMIVDRAISEENATRHLTRKKIGEISTHLLSKLHPTLTAFAKSINTTLQHGTTVSLELFPRETKAFIRKYRKKADTIEIDTAPLYLMANHIKIPAIVILFISDTLNKSYFLRDEASKEVIYKIYNKLPSLIRSL